MPAMFQQGHEGPQHRTGAERPARSGAAFGGGKTAIPASFYPQGVCTGSIDRAPSKTDCASGPALLPFPRCGADQVENPDCTASRKGKARLACKGNCVAGSDAEKPRRPAGYRGPQQRSPAMLLEEFGGSLRRATAVLRQGAAGTRSVSRRDGTPRAPDGVAGTPRT